VRGITVVSVKLVAFGKSVNVTLGLPIVRTSVDHGTAFDIAGKGIADAGSMVEAILLAARLAGAGGGLTASAKATAVRRSFTRRRKPAAYDRS